MNNYNSTFKRKPISEQKPMRRTPLAKKSSRKPKTTPRQKKMALKKELIATYGLPNLECRRYGTNKGFTRTDLLKGMLWNVFSRFIRHRDQGVCISCGASKTYEELQAGHFVPAGGNDIELCFSPENVNGECEPCNAFDSFHLVPMKINLIRKIGNRKVEDLEKKKGMKRSIKWTETDYAQRILHYHDLLKQYD